MGYFSNNRVVDVDEPKLISLANNPNFVTFGSTNDSQGDKPAKMTIRVCKRSLMHGDKCNVTITIEEMLSGELHSFYGVYNEAELNKKSFLMVDSGHIPWEEEKLERTSTIYNLKECLMRDPFLKNNFDIIIRPSEIAKNEDTQDSFFEGGDTIELISKGYGEQYNCDMVVVYKATDKAHSTRDVNIRIGLNDFDYSEVGDDLLCFYWAVGRISLRPLDVSIIQGVFAPSTEAGEFLIVKPTEEGYNPEEAKLETLKNLKVTMEKISAVKDIVDIKLNTSDLTLDCYFVDSGNDYLFDSIRSPSQLFVIETPDLFQPSTLTSYTFTPTCDVSFSQDSIDAGRGGYQIDLDVYTDTGVVWGRDTDSKDAVGTYLATLSKSYFGKPLWFELNTLMSKRSFYSPAFLTAFDAYEKSNTAVWVDAGTWSDYRFVARRSNATSSQPVYMSDVLYLVNGYDYTLNDEHLGYDNLELDNYILNLSQNFELNQVETVKPLTSCTDRTHIKGQKHYFNFILKDRLATADEKLQIAIQYKLYTQSGVFVGEWIDQPSDASELAVINTTLLKLDQFLPTYADKTIGRMDVCLVTYRKNNPVIPIVAISEAISFRILPQYLHKVNDFAFLNRLGGWDSMNFGGATSAEFKVTSSSIYKTLQPSFKKHTEIESTVSKVVEEQRLVQTSPISYPVVEWLRQMSASPAVYELSSNRYVIVDDMTLKYNTKDDLFQVEMKYHYSDVFNGKMK